ncbi:glycosyl hydrolase [Bacteroides sp. 224]|uniref:glycosyl hydrolase n=1 Tax=Bacteroides sp. 224 TaxID=2302936 RepID=UPI0013D80015|nr:glycosyl hydrolase [Bacteroides sp. 224]NDV64760.1 DNA-binding protein [Bacteroides sp. 224]
MNIKPRIILSLLISLFFLQNTLAQPTLQQRFQTPSEEAKPWTIWHWMYGALSKEALTADLETMKEVGLGGAFLLAIKSPELWPHYPGAVKQLTPEWWSMVHHSMKEADRLGLKLGMHICDGFALAGGPWITPKESMQKIVWTDTIISGGKINELMLKQPESFQGYYEDIALYAWPVSSEKAKEYAPKALPQITVSAEVDTTGGFFRVNATNITNPNSDGTWIQYEYPEPYTFRHVEIVKVNNNYQAQRLKVMASDDGVNFRLVKQLIPARQGWQNYDFNDTHAIPPTTARYFRFYWNPTGSEAGSEDMNDAKWKPNLKIKDIYLHSEPRVHHWEAKAGFVWRVANRTPESEISVADCLPKENIINLTSALKDGVLTTQLPKGTWKLLRMGHTSTGHTNATGGAGKGLECDKFSKATVRKQLDNWLGATFRQTDPTLARRVLKSIFVDSWECGSQNWSDNFAAEFKARRGYDLMPYLPLLTGMPIDNIETSENILHDVRTTMAELVVDVFYTELAAFAKEYDCEISAENVSPTMISDGMAHFQKVDRPMGEFWFRSPTHDKTNDMLDAICGAHIYGKNIIQAEAFTQIRGNWDEHPGLMKAMLDRNYALGINKMVFHVFVHNPYLDRKPGMTLDGIGIFFQRDQTWWKHGAKAFVDYVTRTQALLQYGRPVVDIAVFTGEEMPRRAILPERLVPSLPGIFGAERVKSEAKRLANEGTPLRTVAGVTHSANMADPEKWINPLRGYAYDSFNKDALLRLAKVENGRIVLPGGASYKVFVLPTARPMNPDNRPLSPEVQTKVEELRKGGVAIPEIPYPADDFSMYQLDRDVIVPENIAWTHRSGEEAEIYFIANQAEETVSFEASLRYAGNPELWNPITGEITRPLHTEIKESRTIVPLKLAANESVFIVFHRNGSSIAEAPRETKMVALPLEVKEWSVSFPALDNLTLTKDHLFDWSKEEDEKIKYYSGTAVYKTSFKWNGKRKGRIYLSLGEVANIANVRINGIDCGTAWTAPYQVEITNALKKGNNLFEIEVENTWANALNGMDKGKAPYDGIWTNAKYRLKEDKLLPAGLLGPLEMRMEM